uniref:ORF3 n=1 Tax=Torque teno Leptonychotes weddellii virus-1 TaxID=2012676 RepID=A0A1Z2RWM0_9VIRU|nr:ORF3 [Torque teno Leptonychotes weddellii virus 1]ASA48847.1 ORF3 [Torque teno Leptonychotes weddellii virus 1]ASA48967.1 ORF3 [Torque teno Leptonychotes weddellii virus 1]
MIYSRETSTKEAYSQTELIEKFRDVVELTSQPIWSPSPKEGTPPERESETESLRGAESESGQDSATEGEGEDEENPGGEGPPLIPPQ